MNSVHYEWDKRGKPSKNRDRRMLIIGFVLLLFSAYGLASAVTQISKRLTAKDAQTRKELSSSLGQPGPPYTTYDFSDMNRTLKGIEQQLIRMNAIQTRVNKESKILNIQKGGGTDGRNENP